MPKPLLTLFTTPKAFTDPHIAIIQKNAIQSWKRLGNEVEIVLIGEELGVKEVASEFNVCYIPEVDRNLQGTPLVSSIFEKARNLNSSRLLGFINSDIIVFPEILDTCKKVLEQVDKFVLAGQRWDLKVENPLQFKSGWEKKLKENIIENGKRHPPAGSDYFIFPRICFKKIPDFAIGRAGWDNWMIYEARREHWRVIDSTQEITVIHQDHDYRHLPKGVVHHRQPETLENIRLMGGRFAVYTLLDADYYCKNHQVVRQLLTKSRLKREFSIFPAVSLKSVLLGRLFYWIFNYQQVNRFKKIDKKIKAENQ
jgi:hypothetical protein